MKISYNWLQSHITEPLPNVEKLKEVIIFHAFEVESTEKAGDDTIFDIKVLPDRAGDCLSHYGIAREIAGLLSLTLKDETPPAITAPALTLPVEVKSDICRRYTLASLEGIKVGPSPAWLKERLESIGQKSINNIVDAANLVMFDMGQPIHAFDLKKIDGGITVRQAHENETIITLSGESKTLTPDMVVIADYVGALAIAGVKGGKTAEIDEATTSILVEVGNFDPASVRKTARALALPTDASKRFENNFSPVYTTEALARMATIVTEVAGGKVTGMFDYYPKPEEQKTISFSLSDITRLLGTTITSEKIEIVFKRYHYIYTREGETFALTVPFYRADISGAHDIAEEIGRVIGYDAIPETPLTLSLPVQPNETFEQLRLVRALLVSQGFREVMTYTFQKKGDVEVARGAKDKSALRTNLSTGLKESYDKNKLNAALLGTGELKLFEIGNVFFLEDSKIKEETRVGTVEKGTIQELPLHVFCEMHKEALEKIVPITVSSEENKKFVPWSVYPFVARDIAVWFSGEDAKARLQEIYSDFAKKYCAMAPIHFDEFAKDDRISVAYRFIFQASDRTLTEEEVGNWWATLLERLSKEKDFEIR